MELTDEERRVLDMLPTGNVADSNTIQGVMDSGIKPIDPESHMMGRAVTVRCFPGDNLALHQGMAVAKKGNVLVCDCRGYTEAGHFGDMMATACMVKGIAGVVIDGSCRDSQDIKELGLPVFVRAFNPSGTVKESLAEINVPVNCGGVQVMPGDIIFGDCDGVVVIPQADAEIVFTKAKAKFEKEKQLKKEILSGKSTMEIYGFDRVVAAKK
jgi:4-hydroxy-4-methyl-2-oxoglutarate aldolase